MPDTRTRYNIAIKSSSIVYTKIINDGTNPLIVGKPSDYTRDISSSHITLSPNALAGITKSYGLDAALLTITAFDLSVLAGVGLDVALLTFTAFDVTAAHGILPAPTNFTAVRSGDYLSCQLDWDAVAGATSYEIFRSPNYTSQMVLIHTTASLTYNNTGLTAAQPYVYSIRAINTASSIDGIRTLPVYSPSINETH